MGKVIVYDTGGNQAGWYDDQTAFEVTGLTTQDPIHGATWADTGLPVSEAPYFIAITYDGVVIHGDGIFPRYMATAEVIAWLRGNCLAISEDEDGVSFQWDINPPPDLSGWTGTADPNDKPVLDSSVRPHDPSGADSLAEPVNDWWVLNGEDLLGAFDRVREGDDPGVVYLELIANSEPPEDDED